MTAPTPLNYFKTAPDSLCVRNSAESDMPAIQGIYAHHVLTGLASFEETPPDTAELGQRRAVILRLGLPYLSAEIDGRVVGYSYASPYRPRPAYRHTIENSVYIAEGFAGRGIGKALLRELVARCETGPWRQMLAIIGDSGNAGSIGLHHSLDFRLIGTLRAVGFKHGRWLDTVLMQRELGAGGSRPPMPQA
ncbi:GNAT family N-acetyltransferase [Pelagibius sp. Alg239-R121]|uniref:GNAT family N-acetyltransferase n=1 Tax=Pelagibius sp. Alg239-R121 TaxID=2993448 RepID=UPI0024A6EB07|nr:GNAT family N-acetyltransferase [Pelagibius sp. Alg239-R121]